MLQPGSLIAELEDAIQGGAKDKRLETLRRITDLFVADADRLSDKQIDVFDEVLSHLIKRIEGKALVELSGRLSRVDNAPVEVVRRLAWDDNATVASPVLTQSRRLTDQDLVEIANTKSQDHLLAISGRAEVAPTVTDVLLQRGGAPVLHKLAENSGARFSDGGYATLVQRSERDEFLAEKVGSRLDIPIKLFRELLLRATEAVRSRLMALAGPENREKIQSVLDAISEDARRQADLHNEQKYSEAQAHVLELKNKGALNDATFLEFATADRFTEIVAGIALLCEAPAPLIDSLLQSDHHEAWLIPCRVAQLDWRVVRAILGSRSLSRAVSGQFMDKVRAEYTALSQTSAARVLRFWKVRQTTAKGAGGPSGEDKVMAPMLLARAN
jgi:uncharacterized protein (DUF2336 family)